MQEVSIKIGISASVRNKLSTKHKVTEDEIRECFYNRLGEFLLDRNEDHQTDPPTMQFVSRTNKGRLLRVVFMAMGEVIQIKTGHEASQKQVKFYCKHSGVKL